MASFSGFRWLTLTARPGEGNPGTAQRWVRAAAENDTTASRHDHPPRARSCARGRPRRRARSERSPGARGRCGRPGRRRLARGRARPGRSALESQVEQHERGPPPLDRAQAPAAVAALATRKPSAARLSARKPFVVSSSSRIRISQSRCSSTTHRRTGRGNLAPAAERGSGLAVAGRADEVHHGDDLPVPRPARQTTDPGGDPRTRPLPSNAGAPLDRDHEPAHACTSTRPVRVALRSLDCCRRHLGKLHQHLLVEVGEFAFALVERLD